jgi:hypothetical protein
VGEPCAIDRRPVAERDVQELIAGRAGLDGHSGDEVTLGEAQGGGDARTILDLGPEGRVAMLHPDEAGPGRITLDFHRYWTDALLENKTGGFLRDALGGQDPRGADRGMPGERHLVRRREDADRRHAVRAGGGEHEDRLRLVHLAGDGLHLTVVEATAVEEHGQPVAGENSIGEDVDLDELEFACHGERESRGNEAASSSTVGEALCHSRRNGCSPRSASRRA